MKKLLEIAMVMVYNLVLIAGASYLYVIAEVSAWIFAIPILFAASWGSKKDEKDETAV